MLGFRGSRFKSNLSGGRLVSCPGQYVLQLNEIRLHMQFVDTVANGLISHNSLLLCSAIVLSRMVGMSLFLVAVKIAGNHVPVHVVTMSNHDMLCLPLNNYVLALYVTLYNSFFKTSC